MAMISVFIPVYNEEGLLERSARTVHDYLNKRDLEHEIIVVSNGSTDDTDAIGKALEKSGQWLRFFSLEDKGPGKAFVKAIREASAEYFITLDVDLSSDLIFLDYAAHLLEHNVMVVGSKTMGNQRRGLLRVFGSQLYIAFSQYFFDLTISDFSMGCKAMRRADVLPIVSYLDSWTGYIFELCLYMRLAKKKVVQVGIDCDDTRESRFSLLHEGFYRFRHLYRCYKLLQDKSSWFHTKMLDDSQE